MLEELIGKWAVLHTIVGLAQNAVLLRDGATALREARLRFQATKQTVQHFDAFAYAAESWPQARARRHESGSERARRPIPVLL